MMSFSDVSYPAHIIERIRLLYKHREERLLPVPWSEDFSFHLNDIFTRLRILSKEKTRGTLTDDITNMTGIFKEHAECQKPRIVLIEGEPGMGKTTYCQKLAYDWATKQGEWDQSFPEIEVLLLLRCHDIESDIWEAIDGQILPEDIDEQAKKSFNKFIQENQSKVLLVLDGLDEADASKLRLYFRLVESKELPYCHIVLTSRHEAGKKFRRYSDTLWEIVGFTAQDAQSFIRKYFQNMEHLAKKLIERLWGDVSYDDSLVLSDDNSELTDGVWDDSSDDDSLVLLGDDADGERELKELTKNPLNTVLLCVLFEDCKGVLAKNRTQLYNEIVLCVLRRYEKKNGLQSVNEDLIGLYKKELSQLGRIALRSLRKRELYIEEHEFGCNSSLLIKFGFLSTQTSGVKRKPFMRCGFFHKSFQEFFAGFYLAFQILEGEITCDSVVADERYLDELNHVFLFMSGIVASQREESALSLVNSIAAHTNLQDHDKVNLYLQLALKCISECSAHRQNLQSRLVCTLGKHLRLKTLNMPYVKPAELFFDALTVNTSLNGLDLSENGVGETGAASLSQALTANSSLTSLDLSSNTIGEAGATFLSQALTANSSLTSLDLSRTGIGDSGATSLSQALTANSSLTSLNLSYNSIGKTGAASLFQALTANSSLTSLDLSRNRIGNIETASPFQVSTANSSLTSLGLNGNSIDDSGATSLSQALTTNSSLTSLDLRWNSTGDSWATYLSQALTKNSSLTSLNLSYNGIGDSGATFLSQTLKANSSLTSLNLRENSIGDSGVTSLSQALIANSSLTSLDLSWNGIDDSGATSLSQALTANSSLASLNLRENSIGDSGVTFLSQALAANSSLTSLDLSKNGVGETGAASFSQALTANSSLTSLNLGYNYIYETGATSLSQALTTNSSLTSLDLIWNGIGDSGATSLSQALTANSSLTSLNLRENSIGDSGATSLSQALTANSSLTSLNLSENSIGETGAASLSQALTANRSLTCLVLSRNIIGDSGATSLSQALTANTSLTSLNLSWNSIGETGATSLSQALTANSSLTSLDLSGNRISSFLNKFRKTVNVIL